METKSNYFIPVMGLVNLSEDFIYAEDVSEKGLLTFIAVTYIQVLILGSIAIGIFWSWL